MRVIRSKPNPYVEEWTEHTYLSPSHLKESQQELDAIEEIRQRRFNKAMALKEAIGLTKAERHELAQLLPGVDKDDGGSWKDLSPKELHDLITMMEGFIFISHLLIQRVDTDDEGE